MSEIGKDTTNVEFVCVWCGHNLHNDPEKWTCNAPDGDGHLYERKPCKPVVKEKEDDS